MIKVKYLGRVPEYLEGFPDCCTRSIEGSIHLVPNGMKKMSVGEYDHIKKCRPDIYNNLLIVSRDPLPKKKVLVTNSKKDVQTSRSSSDTKEVQYAKEISGEKERSSANKSFTVKKKSKNKG